MLAALEALLFKSVDAVLRPGVKTHTGPWQPTGTGGVTIHARTLTLNPPGEDPPTDDPAHGLVEVNWTTNGQTLDFEIPANQSGELVEVEAPLGFTVGRDAWQLDDRTIRFYRAPRAGQPGVRARLRGAAAKGFKRRKQGRVDLRVSAWAKTMEDADTRLNIALQTSLPLLIDLPNLEAARVKNVQVLLRLLQARVWLLDIERSLEPNSALFEATARLQLCGELDQIVAIGTPDPVGVIEQLGWTLRIDRASSQPQPSVSPLGPRPIEAMSIVLLDQVSPQTKADFAALSMPVETLGELARLDIEAIVAELAKLKLTEPKVHEFKQRAGLLLEFIEIPALEPASLDITISALLALDPAGLASLLGVDHGYAQLLSSQLWTAKILLKSSALASLKLSDFVVS